MKVVRCRGEHRVTATPAHFIAEKRIKATLAAKWQRTVRGKCVDHGITTCVEFTLDPDELLA